MASLKKWSIGLIFIAIAIAVFAVIWSDKEERMSCIFCDIINKKADTELLYEDEVDNHSLELNRTF